jgi:DNA gyrase subunit A
MQLQRLTGLEMKKLAKEYAELCEQIEGYSAILASEEVLVDIIREDIYELKEKYGDKRRTQIAAKVEQFDIEDLIAEEEVIVTISHSGYVKRTAIDTYRKQGRGGKGVIGSDMRCYWLKVYDVPSMSRQSKGRSMANLLNLGSQTIASIINVRKFDREEGEQGEERQLVMATQNGLVKKTKLSAYSNPRVTGVTAIKLDPNDDVIAVALTTGGNHIILGTREGMSIRFDEKQVRSMGRVSRGVKGIKLRQKDRVVGMVVAEARASLLTVCENGYGKRTDLADYRAQSRGGIGLINIKTSDRNGKVVALKAVQDDDELMMITANGIIIRTGLEEVRSIGRNTQGVRLIKLGEGDELVAAAKIAGDVEDEPDGTGEQTEAEVPEGDEEQGAEADKQA